MLFFSVRYNTNKREKYQKTTDKKMESWEELYRMTFIKVRRQLTKEGEGKKQESLQTKLPPQPRNLIQYKSPGIKLFRLMARQTNVVETRLWLYNQDQHPRSATPPTLSSLHYSLFASHSYRHHHQRRHRHDHHDPRLDSEVVRS